MEFLPPVVRLAAACVFALLAVAGVASPVRSDSALGGRIHPVALDGGCQLVNVGSIAIERYRQGWYLRIGGYKQLVNMEVGLEHRRAGAGLWRVGVVGCTPGIIGLPVSAPYELFLPVSDFRGARGLEIVAANGVWRQRLPGR